MKQHNALVDRQATAIEKERSQARQDSLVAKEELFRAEER